MPSATNLLLATQYTLADTHSFVLSGSNHVLLGGDKTLVGPGSVSLESWVRQCAVGDPSCVNVR